MARTVKEHEYRAKRGEILDSATRLLYLKGYESMTIQDILADLGISSGAFYHYFDSKSAVLEGFIQRIKETVERPLLPIVRNPDLSALDKLRGFFDTINRLRVKQKAQVAELGRVWYSDSNAIVRLKVDEAIAEQRAPLLAEIVSEGVEEGVFTTRYPDEAGEVIMAMLQGMGSIHAKLLLSLARTRENETRDVERVVTTHAAYMDAIERVLGTPVGSLYRTSGEEVKAWVAASRGEQQTP